MEAWRCYPVVVRHVTFKPFVNYGLDATYTWRTGLGYTWLNKQN